MPISSICLYSGVTIERTPTRPSLYRRCCALPLSESSRAPLKASSNPSHHPSHLIFDKYTPILSLKPPCHPTRELIAPPTCEEEEESPNQYISNHPIIDKATTKPQQSLIVSRDGAAESSTRDLSKGHRFHLRFTSGFGLMLVEVEVQVEIWALKGIVNVRDGVQSSRMVKVRTGLNERSPRCS